MTRYEDRLIVPSGDSSVHPEYHRLVAEHAAAAGPVLAALEARGWTEVTLDPDMDWESPYLPDGLLVYADVPAGDLGVIPVLARLVLDRAATQHDAFRAMGAAELAHARPVLVAAEYEPDDLPETFSGALRDQVTFLSPGGLGIGGGADAAAVPDVQRCALDVISLAQAAGMPDTFWATDSRIDRACAVLGISPTEARALEPDPAE